MSEYLIKESANKFDKSFYVDPHTSVEYWLSTLWNQHFSFLRSALMPHLDIQAA